MTILLIPACSNGSAPITGKWRRGQHGETVEFRSDGTVALQDEYAGCTGDYKEEKKKRTYRINLDCGVSRASVTGVVSSDGKRLTVTSIEGKKGEYTRLSG
ncbi:hypothetical protein [Actinomadura rubrisoli]|uniref:DUF2147 domain-containing protein n=1 Tax=Actinomadura rubrisoli TaxID=2530368 RepID=A0A4R5BYG0_9ACTN|nr:hypothetical protein [Actinomadura rubrisoli]TDD90763.1 hypothetical protein E1298_12745 [Actinomadura rubrisoli]